MKQFLNLPERAKKPRTKGKTYVIDGGIATGMFEDTISSSADLIDMVKFGWGTPLVTADIKKKVEALAKHKINFHFGGTFFEKALLQNKVEEYIVYLKDLGCRYVEISNGTIDIDNVAKAKYIERFAKDFEVVSEVGYKDVQRSQDLQPSKWIQYIQQDLNAGAQHVILEARESGASGFCRSNGEVRYGLIIEIIESGVPVEQLIFEAPNKYLQIYFIERLGPDVNLSNIPATGIIGLETLRLGLRSDTLTLFDEGTQV